MSESEQERFLAAQGIGQLMSDFRREYVNWLVEGVTKECDEVAESGYDPAAGSGRGPWWANGDMP
jgi:hypothetical protein